MRRCCENAPGGRPRRGSAPAGVAAPRARAPGDSADPEDLAGDRGAEGSTGNVGGGGGNDPRAGGMRVGEAAAGRDAPCTDAGGTLGRRAGGAAESPDGARAEAPAPDEAEAPERGPGVSAADSAASTLRTVGTVRTVGALGSASPPRGSAARSARVTVGGLPRLAPALAFAGSGAVERAWATVGSVGGGRSAHLFDSPLMGAW